MLLEKFENMLGNPDFGQEYWLRTAIGLKK